MDRNKIVFALLLLILPFICCSNKDDIAPSDDNKHDDEENTVYLENRENLQRVKGNSIQIDPLVLYSLEITPQELVSDLKKANITSVHYVVVNKWDGSKDDQIFKPEFMEALEENGIAIWLMLPGNCMYDQLPGEWEMEFVKPYAEASLRFYSFHNNEYVTWQEERVKRVFENYDFAGIGFAESYFPEWRTLYTNGHYGDVSLAARRKFTREYLGLDRSALSFDAIRNNTEWYYKWQDFRVEAITDFNRRMKKAVRDANPKALFASWGIAVGSEPLSEIREWYGLDMVEIAKEVKPDLFFIQTSYQDWGDPALPSDYIKNYEHVRRAIQEANPNVKLAVQADIASLSFHNPGVGVRVPDWWLEFMELSTRLGYYTSTSYEYAFSKKQGLWIE